MTYSIIARDAETGDMWVAVQTHWFWVGNNVPWLKPWVWAIATQALTEMKYWYDGLALLEKWKTPEELLEIIWNTDEAYESRQVAIIDNLWNIATHTGKECLRYAGTIIWDNYVVQWNCLTNDTVLESMAQAYEKNLAISFPERLLLSLQAWQDAWWEIRWQQSSALTVVSNKKWDLPKISLKIDNSKTPISDLSELLSQKYWYDLLMEAEEVWAVGEIEDSLELFKKVKQCLPWNDEVDFWEAFMLYNRWKKDEAASIIDKKFTGKDNWQELWRRVVEK